MRVSVGSGGSASLSDARGAGPSFEAENLLHVICRVTAKAPCECAHQVKIDGALRTLIGRASIKDVLWAAREALQCDESLASDKTQSLAGQRDLERAHE